MPLVIDGFSSNEAKAARNAEREYYAKRPHLRSIQCAGYSIPPRETFQQAIFSVETSHFLFRLKNSNKIKDAVNFLNEYRIPSLKNINNLSVTEYRKAYSQEDVAGIPEYVYPGNGALIPHTAKNYFEEKSEPLSSCYGQNFQRRGDIVSQKEHRSEEITREVRLGSFGSDQMHVFVERIRRVNLTEINFML
jgi:hypothetical protein